MDKITMLEIETIINKYEDTHLSSFEIFKIIANISVLQEQPYNKRIKRLQNKIKELEEQLDNYLD